MNFWWTFNRIRTINSVISFGLVILEKNVMGMGHKYQTYLNTKHIQTLAGKQEDQKVDRDTDV